MKKLNIKIVLMLSLLLSLIGCSGKYKLDGNYSLSTTVSIGGDDYSTPWDNNSAKIKSDKLTIEIDGKEVFKGTLSKSREEQMDKIVLDVYKLENATYDEDTFGLGFLNLDSFEYCTQDEADGGFLTFSDSSQRIDIIMMLKKK